MSPFATLVAAVAFAVLAVALVMAGLEPPVPEESPEPGPEAEQDR